MSQCDWKIDFYGSFVSMDPENDFVAFEDCLEKSSKELNAVYNFGIANHWSALKISKFAHAKIKEATFFKQSIGKYIDSNESSNNFKELYHFKRYCKSIEVL
jgi:hypothetical protein